jgi:CDP-6-deoxy-D-xylo-4-hexulose-3-dehydrase
MQAAVGLAQLERLDEFVATRRRNWLYLRDGLKDLEEFLLLPVPTPNSDPSWFGFCLTVHPNDLFERNELLVYLNNQCKIGTRLLFAGNLTRQPYMHGRQYRVVGPLDNSDVVMNSTFWVGLYPGLTRAHLDHTISSIRSFINGRR